MKTDTDPYDSLCASYDYNHLIYHTVMVNNVACKQNMYVHVYGTFPQLFWLPCRHYMEHMYVFTHIKIIEHQSIMQFHAR